MKKHRNLSKFLIILFVKFGRFAWVLTDFFQVSSDVFFFFMLLISFHVRDQATPSPKEKLVRTVLLNKIDRLFSLCVFNPCFYDWPATWLCLQLIWPCSAMQNITQSVRIAYLVATDKSYQKCLSVQSLARNVPRMQPHCHTGCPRSNKRKTHAASDENNMDQLAMRILAGCL